MAKAKPHGRAEAKQGRLGNAKIAASKRKAPIPRKTNGARANPRAARAPPAKKAIVKKQRAKNRPPLGKKLPAPRPEPVVAPMKLRSGRVLAMRKEAPPAPSKPASSVRRDPRGDSKADPAAAGTRTLKAVEALRIADFAVDMAHLEATEHRDVPVKELVGKAPPLGRLMQLWRSAKLPAADLGAWFPHVKNKSDLGNGSLDALVSYCEAEERAGRSTVKRQLQYIIAALEAGKCSAPHILLTLVSHSGMCNVQKEIGVRMSYAAITNSLAQEAQQRSLRSHVLRFLEGLREQIPEAVFIKLKDKLGFFWMNSHALVPFRNLLAPHVGLDQIPEPNNMFHHPFQASWVTDFFKIYTVGYIVDAFLRAVNQLPAKIPGQALVAWLTDHCPRGVQPDAFLGACYDDDGLLKPFAALYALETCGVLARKKPAASKAKR